MRSPATEDMMALRYYQNPNHADEARFQAGERDL
jgi:hypothetical protein